MGQLNGQSFSFASQLYALNHNVQCKGPEKCHWCGAPCERLWINDEPQNTPFVRGPKTTAKCPGNPYICVGCWLWRKKYITANFLDNSYLDRQTPANHSWLVTLSGVNTIREADYVLLLDKLLNPHPKFVLSLLDRNPTTSGSPQAIKNHLQYNQINWNEKVQQDTPLKFTVNNIEYEYTVYELKKALENTQDSNGKSPGVQELIRILGKSVEKNAQAQKIAREAEEKKKQEGERGKGRPPALEDAKQLKKNVVTK